MYSKPYLPNPEPWATYLTALAWTCLKFNKCSKILHYIHWRESISQAPRVWTLLPLPAGPHCSDPTTPLTTAPWVSGSLHSRGKIKSSTGWNLVSTGNSSIGAAVLQVIMLPFVWERFMESWDAFLFTAIEGMFRSWKIHNLMEI